MCCGEVKTAMANPALVDYLCATMGYKNFTIPIDMKHVLTLPGSCRTSNTTFSKCHNESLMLLCFFHLGSFVGVSILRWCCVLVYPGSDPFYKIIVLHPTFLILKINSVTMGVSRELEKFTK
jgi:hypothetical protein